jgi:YD repeat-containing protein
VLVRSGAPDDPTDIWDYDEQGRLLYQRQSQASRTYGEYIMTHTFTYDDNTIVRAARAEVPDSTIDYVETYVFEAGLLRVLTHAGTDYTGADYTTTAHYDYDANQRLVRIQDVASSYTKTQVLERRETGEPFRWFVDDVLKCLYSWRVSWLGTECYDENGEVSETYVRTGDGQLGAIISSVSTNEFEYDATGRLTSGFGTSYEYDATGRLSSSRTGSQVTQFFYDDLGLLHREETVQETGVYTTDYTYERTAHNEVTQRAIRGEYVVAHTYRWMDVAPRPIPTELSFTDEMHMSYPRVYQHPVDYSVVE